MSNPDIIFNKVVLPAPLCPNKHIVSLDLKDVDIFINALKSP